MSGFAVPPGGGFLSQNSASIGFGGAAQWTVDSSGFLVPTASATYDIGKTGALPRDVLCSRQMLAGSAIGLSFASDTNTGLNNPNADHIALCAGNAQMFSVRLDSGTAKIGFFATAAATPVALQVVTGSKGANAALTSLLAALAAYGLITDSSS